MIMKNDELINNIEKMLSDSDFFIFFFVCLYFFFIENVMCGSGRRWQRVIYNIFYNIYKIMGISIYLQYTMCIVNIYVIN